MKYVLRFFKKVFFSVRDAGKFCVRRKGAAATVILAIFFFLGTLYSLFIYAPRSFPLEYTFTIEEGANLSSISQDLKEQNVIKSPLAIKVIITMLGKQLDIQAGDYYFHKPLDVFEISERIVTGDYGLEPVAVRVPEGATIFDIGALFGNKFSSFSEEAFVELALAENAEGYLFPDTYFFLPNVKEDKVYATLRENFDAQVASIETEITEFGVPLSDVVIMASLIEKESANDFEERKMISGILWNRINIGMALQVDAVFPYINGKNTFQLSTEDLTIDSPYNTYKYPGLPIGPIANPSLDSLLAAVTPTDNQYLFYLHDLGGNVHYSVDFEGHKRNKFRYLR